MNRMALDARCTLAMARVLAPIDPLQAAELQQRSVELAREVPWRLEPGAPAPLLFEGEHLLLQAFAEAQTDADRFAAFIEEHPPLVWSDGWTPSLDGRHETCPCVARSREGFLAGLMVSCMGGDCNPRYGDAVPTLEEAIAIAQARDTDWHLADTAA